jgi:hypothetical protein
VLAAVQASPDGWAVRAAPPSHANLLKTALIAHSAPLQVAFALASSASHDAAFFGLNLLLGKARAAPLPAADADTLWAWLSTRLEDEALPALLRDRMCLLMAALAGA